MKKPWASVAFIVRRGGWPFVIAWKGEGIKTKKQPNARENANTEQTSKQLQNIFQRTLNQFTMKVVIARLILVTLFSQVYNIGHTQNTINVPADFSTIQEAINAAIDGDVVLVDTGTYYENLEIIGKTIILASHYFSSGDEAHRENTKIVGDGANTISFLDDSRTLLTGFTVTIAAPVENDTLRRNIKCSYASPVIVDNIIENGIARGAGGATSDKWGGGILITHGNPIVFRNTIKGNRAWTRGGGIAISCGNPLIGSNIIEDNFAEAGGGIYCGGSNATIQRNIIDGNRSFFDLGGGGLFLVNTFDVVINNTIVNNENTCCGGKGGGVYSVNSFVEIFNNIITHNSADTGGGGGVYCSDDLGITTIRHNLLFGNTRYNNSPNNFETDTLCRLDSTSTIFLNPEFVDFDNQNYELSAPGSPAIDAGLIEAKYNDPEDPMLPGMALAPARGTLRSDLGAWGGAIMTLDSDRDGIADQEETDTNPILPDTDGDGVLDGEEDLVFDTDPNLMDSDGDGFNDGFEIEMCTDPKVETSFPVVEKTMTYELLLQETSELAQEPFDSLPFYSVAQLDPPLKPGSKTLGMDFNEGLKINIPDNALDTLNTYCFGRPRASLDRTKVRIYLDREMDGSFRLLSYEELAADYSVQEICPPVDAALLPITGKFIAKLIIGHCRPDTASCPQLFDFGGTGYVRFSEYGGLYGASYRAGTRNVFGPMEEFPEFRELYYAIVDSDHSVLFGKLDAAAYTGALEYTLIPGFTTDMKVKATFFPRTELGSEELGVVGYSSMFWKDQDSTITITNDEAHDSDWLVVGFDQNNDGVVDQIVEHQIINPDSATHLLTTNFNGTVSGEQIYFALENRDRVEAHYTRYADADYHLRSSYSIQILKSNVPLSLKLYERHTTSEYEDNIAMEVVVQDVSLSPSDTVSVEYITRAYNPIDSDGDALTDQLERLIGTCIDSSDTDEDGNSDHAELVAGTNPRNDIVIEALPQDVTIEANPNETVQTTIQFTNLVNCVATTPILGMALQANEVFTIVDTLGDFSECPYLLAEGGTFSLIIEFSSAEAGAFLDTLVVTLVDTIIQVPLMADIVSSTETVNNSKSVEVFPNPSSGSITISLDGWTGEIIMELIDIQGRIVNRIKRNDTNQGNIKIQMNEIPSGSYLIKIANNEFHAVKKLIVQ